MNNCNYDKLDAIMSLATAEYVKELNEEFLNAECAFEVSYTTKQRILRMIRKDKFRTNHRKTRTVFKYIMVAALIAATVAFTACMALPRIREAIWKAVLDWHDEYVSIQFVPATTEDPNASANKPSDPNSTDTNEKPNDPIIVPPTSIEEVNVPSYMPMGYRSESTLMERTYTANYFDKNNAFMFCYTQMIIDSDSKGDGEEGTATEITINGLSAIVLTYSDEPNVYTLYWQDQQYRYRIYGYFEDYNELIRIATSVDVK